jgi:hypothetical protein
LGFFVCTTGAAADVGDGGASDWCRIPGGAIAVAGVDTADADLADVAGGFLAAAVAVVGAAAETTVCQVQTRRP